MKAAPPGAHTPAPGRPVRRVRGGMLLLVAAVAAGVVLRGWEVDRPIDHTSHNEWRECDYGMIARNFWRGGINPLAPQIDWRKDTPGHVESEFPLLPALMAGGYRAFGYDERIGRALALAMSLATMLLFYYLARLLLNRDAARWASALFALNPLMTRFGSSIQPDVPMLLALMGAALLFFRWERRGVAWCLPASGAVLGVAVALKGPAIALLPVFALCAWFRLGARLFRVPGAWLGLALAVALPLAWYTHSHRYWVWYGNSLGLTNQPHFIGWDLLRRPGLLADMLAAVARMETKYVFGFLGPVAAAAALLRTKSRTLPVALWTAAAVGFCLLCLRTTAQGWAVYYHAIAVPPACLLIAAAPGHAVVRRWVARRWHPLAPAWLLGAAARALALIGSAAVSCRSITPTDAERARHAGLELRYLAAHAFSPLVPHGALVATGGDNGALDPTGRPLAHDDPTMLFWMDRKGFALPVEWQTAEVLDRVAAQGATFATARAGTDFEALLRRRWRVVAEAHGHLLATSATVAVRRDSHHSVSKPR